MREVEQPKKRKTRHFESAPAQPSCILVNPMDKAHELRLRLTMQSHLWISLPFFCLFICLGNELVKAFMILRTGGV